MSKKWTSSAPSCKLIRSSFNTSPARLHWFGRRRDSGLYLAGIAGYSGIVTCCLCLFDASPGRQSGEALRADASWSTFHGVLPFVIGMAIVLLLTELLSYVTGFVRTVQGEMVRDHISGLIHKKSVEADLAFYDMPDYYDRLYRAQYHALDRPLALLESLGGVLQNGITLVAMVAVLVPYGIWMPVASWRAVCPRFMLYSTTDCGFTNGDEEHGERTPRLVLQLDADR